MKYRKKPVVIEAVRWWGTSDSECWCQLWDLVYGTPAERLLHIAGGVLFIETLEGTMKVSEGDYIIKGVRGELYPCKPDIFRETYELVES